MFGRLSLGAPSALKEYTPEPAFWDQPLAWRSEVPPASGREELELSFFGLVQGAMKRSSPVFTCIAIRASVFAEARFQFQRMTNGRPGDLFGTPALSVLEQPWVNGTTGELLARVEIDASTAGNAYIARRNDGRLKRLRPDWMSIVVGSNGEPEEDPFGLDAEVVGYWFKPPNRPGMMLTPRRVAHYKPIPDPESQFRGMSWITPVMMETKGDTAASEHKYRFFENGATPSTVITYDKATTPERLKEFAAAYRESHAGASNAYKTLHLGGGADLRSFGADMKQLDFKALQGASESRIAAASGVGAVIGQFSEGMAGSALNAGNYAAARRRFGDMTMRPLWRHAAGALAPLVDVPAGARLWYDDRDIPFLQDDQKDAAAIQAQKAATIRTLIEAGYDPDRVVAAVQAEDMGQLVGAHSGRLSVQLQDPAVGDDEPEGGDDDDA